MLKRSYSGNDLANFYYSCVLLRKYYQYDLWFGSFGEYDNIKYCRKYIQIYMYRWINIFLLQHFNLFFVVFLYKSSCFVKFVESGFLKYLDYHFLLSFYNNCFTFDLKGKQKIKVFVKLYFQNFIKSRLEKDILILVIKVMDEIILNALIKHLTSRLKSTEIYAGRIKLNDKDLDQRILSEDKKKDYLVGLFYFYYLINTGYYRPYNTELSSFYVIDYFYCFISLNNVCGFRLLFRMFNNKKKTLKYNFKPVKISKLVMEENFIKFSQNILGPLNENILYVARALEFLGRFNVQQKKIGLYKNLSLFFERPLPQKSLLSNKSFKSSELVFKRFNNYFVKYGNKRKFHSKFLISCNLKFFRAPI